MADKREHPFSHSLFPFLHYFMRRSVLKGELKVNFLLLVSVFILHKKIFWDKIFSAAFNCSVNLYFSPRVAFG